MRASVREVDSGSSLFEQVALSCLGGRVLDHGCGLGHLAPAAARRGCGLERA